MDTYQSIELYKLYVKAEEGKQWLIFYEKTIHELQKQADEIDELSEKISTDEAGIKVLAQVINKAKELQKHIDDAINDIKWYGGRPEVRPTMYGHDLRYMPLPTFEEENPKPKKATKYQPSNEYKEMLTSHLKNAQIELETIIKSYTRRKDIIYPQLKKMGESLINQGIKVVQEQATTLFPYQVETYFVELRPKKGQKEITDKMFEEIFPSDETVCIEKYLEFMEVVVIGIEKGTKDRKVSTIKINMKSNGPVKMADIDRGNYANLVQKFNKELGPITSKLNQLIEEGKDPVATLEQARKVKQYLEEATEHLRKYETKQDKKPNLEHFDKLEATIEKRIQLEQHKIFLNNLNQEVNREGAKTSELIQQKANPAAIIQEATRFKGKVEEMKKQEESFDYERHQVVHNREKVLQDLTGIIQQIDQIIKEQEEKLTGEKLLVNPTGKGIRNDEGGLGHFGAPRKGRTHMGIDFSTTVGQDIVAPLTGRVRNLIGNTTGYPMIQIYPKKIWEEFDYLEMLYVDAPSGIKMGEFRQVTAQDSVGIAMSLQDPRLNYPANVTPHVHLQIKKKMPGQAKPIDIDPTPFFPDLSDK